MGSCELCGKNTGLKKANVEGVIVSVCSNCIGYGKEIYERTFKKVQPRIISESNERIIENFSTLIKNKRLQLNLTQKDLAQKVAEKESLISRIESGFKPSIPTAKKLERFLKLNLIEEQSSEEYKNESVSSGPMTIGDLLKNAK